jgi:hypothetical protein
LEKKNRKKRSSENLHQISCFSERVQSWHDEHILVATMQLCRCFAVEHGSATFGWRRALSLL